MATSRCRLLWNPDGRPLYVLDDGTGELRGIGQDGETFPFTGEASSLQDMRSGGTPRFPIESLIDVVGVAEVAARAGVLPTTVHKWRQRHADFPAPFAMLAAGPIWTWESIARWLRLRPPLGRPGRTTIVPRTTPTTVVSKPLRATGAPTYRLRDRYLLGTVRVSASGHPVTLTEHDDGHTLTFPEPPAAGVWLQLEYRSLLA